MEKGEINNLLSYVIIVLFLLVIILLSIDLINVFKADKNCAGNPLVYGVRELERLNKQDVSCRCTFNEVNSPTLFITDINMTMLPPLSYSGGGKPINISKDELNRILFNNG